MPLMMLLCSCEDPIVEPVDDDEDIEVVPDTIPVSSVSLDCTKALLKPDEQLVLTASLAPEDATDQTVVWSSSDESVASVADGVVTALRSGKTTITALAGEIVAECKIAVTGPAEAVDLGLEVKWASWNVGASCPEDFGDYYAWGEIEPYYTNAASQSIGQSIWREGKENGYDWTSYRWCDGTANYMTKYCTNAKYGDIDKKKGLDLADDVAHAEWGDKWRMPTRNDFNKLKSYCTWTWTKENGVEGFRVTSKIEGYTDKSIFIPAAGLRGQMYLSFVGNFGYYWTSSLTTTTMSNAYEFYFANGGSPALNNESRCFGRTVRPVYDPELVEDEEDE